MSVGQRSGGRDAGARFGGGAAAGALAGAAAGALAGAGAAAAPSRGRGSRLFARLDEADPHARCRRIRRLDDLGHARVLVLVVDLQDQRGPDRQRLAEDDEGARIGAIAHLR